MDRRTVCRHRAETVSIRPTDDDRQFLPEKLEMTQSQLPSP